MKKFKYIISLILLFLLLATLSVALARNKGVDDLRGRWDVEWSFNDKELSLPLIFFINDLSTNSSENTFVAIGCMHSPGTDAFMPLSLRAIYDPEKNSYLLNLYSTVIPVDTDPYLILFNGTIQVNGIGVTDDRANGSLTTEFAGGTWSAVHHDRRRTKCPNLRDFGMGVQGDVSVRQDLAYQTPTNRSIFEIYSVIVSSGMQVERPDGSTFVVQEYTDIFSPDVDFIGFFRYHGNYEGTPVSGGAYHFSLLDIFGDPIPGTESTDVWTACVTDAPTALETRIEKEGFITLSWDSIDNVTGQFEPGSNPQIGFYQIGISPNNWEGGQEYGSNDILSPWHDIPMNSFEPGSNGTPNGFDYGLPLSKFEDGVYLVASEAFSEPSPGSGGFHLECAVFDTSENLIMTKNGDIFTFEKVSTISSP
jgi:hypothetical protein